MITGRNKLDRKKFNIPAATVVNVHRHREELLLCASAFASPAVPQKEDAAKARPESA
jgi:hypothetical protein